MTDYQGKSRCKRYASHITTEEFKEFFAHFKALNNEQLCIRLTAEKTQNPPFTVSSAAVAKAFGKINPQKSGGPDKILG